MFDYVCHFMRAYGAYYGAYLLELHHVVMLLVVQLWCVDIWGIYIMRGA